MDIALPSLKASLRTASAGVALPCFSFSAASVRRQDADPSLDPLDFIARLSACPRDSAVCPII
jgi:hypothetical protein